MLPSPHKTWMIRQKEGGRSALIEQICTDFIF